MSYQLPSTFLQKFTPKEIHEAKRVFKEHDKDYAAAISTNEIQHVFLSLGENVSPAQVSTMLKQVQLDHPDKITYQEFLTLLYDYRTGGIIIDSSLLSQTNDVSSGVPPPLPTWSQSATPSTWSTQNNSEAVNSTTAPSEELQRVSITNKTEEKNITSRWSISNSNTPNSPSPPKYGGSKPQWPPANSPNTSQTTEVIGTSTIKQASPAKPQWPPAPIESKSISPGQKQSSFKKKTQWPPSPAPDEATSTPTNVSPITKKQWPPTTPQDDAAGRPSLQRGGSSKRWPPQQESSSEFSQASTQNSKQLSTSPPAQLDNTAIEVLQRRSVSAAAYSANSTIHEIKGSTHNTVHFYSEEETSAFTAHINSTLARDPDLTYILPIANTKGELFTSINDGVLLCKLINAAIPETIDFRAVNAIKNKKSLNVYEKSENHNLCINAAKSIGCSVVNIGPADLIEGKPILVLGLIWQIIKIQLTSTINLKNHPELMRLLLEGETLDQFMKLPPDQILLRWMNYHLRAANHPKVITNFSTDLMDASAYSVLLHHIAPSTCDLCHETQVEDRAAHVIANARKLEVDTSIKPRDITSGNPKLNIMFVAQLFNTCPALDMIVEELADLEDILYDDVGDTREERVFRMWINSLGIDDLYINHLFSDLRDGLNLLRVLDKIHKGIVVWSKVNMDPNKLNKFKQVENCNYCVVLGKQLKFSLVNIGGADIYEGAKKLILSIVWQAMRYHQLSVLSELSRTQSGNAHSAHIMTDSDILNWANNKVRQSTMSNMQIAAFRDPKLSDALYLLALVSAIEPRAVNWDQVVQGGGCELSEDDKASNAKYAISCAQKIGATVFLTFEDIIEVKPKMMMAFVASLMSVDICRK